MLSGWKSGLSPHPWMRAAKRHEFLRAVQDETGALSVLPDQDSSLLRPLHRLAG